MARKKNVFNSDLHYAARTTGYKDYSHFIHFTGGAAYVTNKQVLIKQEVGDSIGNASLLNGKSIAAEDYKILRTMDKAIAMEDEVVGVTHSGTTVTFEYAYRDPKEIAMLLKRFDFSETRGELSSIALDIRQINTIYKATSHRGAWQFEFKSPLSAILMIPIGDTSVSELILVQPVFNKY